MDVVIFEGQKKSPAILCDIFTTFAKIFCDDEMQLPHSLYLL